MLIIALLAVTSINCQTYVTPNITCPQPLSLPVIEALDLELITDDTYKKLDIRDTKMKERIKTLRAMFC